MESLIDHRRVKWRCCSIGSQRHCAYGTWDGRWRFMSYTQQPLSYPRTQDQPWQACFDVSRVPPTIKETQTNQMLTRSVRDLAMSFTITEQRGDNATYPELGFISGPSSKRLKIAVALKTEDGLSADADVLDVVMRTAERCKLMGHEVVELDCVPYHVEEFLDQFMDIYFCLDDRAWRLNFEKMHGRPVADGDFETLWMYYLNAMPDDPDAAIETPMETANKISDAFDRHFESYDLILTPTVPVVAKEAADRSIE